MMIKRDELPWLVYWYLLNYRYTSRVEWLACIERGQPEKKGQGTRWREKRHEYAVHDIPYDAREAEFWEKRDVLEETGIKRLCRCVIEDVYLVLDEGRVPRGVKRGIPRFRGFTIEDYHDTLDWLEEDDSLCQRAFSLDWCCMVLGKDARVLREQLRELFPAQKKYKRKDDRRKPYIYPLWRRENGENVRQEIRSEVALQAPLQRGADSAA